MCGIAGVWNRSGEPVDPAALDRMGSILRHRGPDGSGTLLRGDLGLVHRRLTIVDLTDRGHQPMAVPDESLWVNYNGEIHNYRELRRELEDAGVAFRSECDTEVALWAYRVWGTECFERFNGMWAIALWDARAERLVLSRDRFGIKPLYYAARGDRVAFASEAKAILAAFPEEREPDRREIYAFLAGGQPDVGDATFFRNVRAVPPGTYLELGRDRCERRTYWGFRPGEESPCPDAEERFLELLDDAVRLRMRSDVPVGVCVSGGLDSTAIVRLAARHTAAPLECFALRYEDPRVDESHYSRVAADDPARYRTHWVEPSPRRMLDTMRAIVWHHDAPTPARARFGQWFIMREVGRHVKVVLDGAGSDEQLAGYPRFFGPYLLDRLRDLGPTQSLLSTLGSEARDLAAVSGRASLLSSLGSPLKRRLGLGDPARRVCRHDFAAAFGPAPQDRYLNAYHRPDMERPFRSRLNNALWTDFRHVGLPETLHSGDALSMAFSVESRPPFLDHRLVEFCFSLPYHEKIRDGWTKSILRRALRDVLPEQIRTRRPKLGFPAPLGSWLRSPENLREVEAVLLDPRSLDRGIFDGTRLERRPQELRTAGPGRERAEQLWRWLTLELWFRQFVDDGQPELTTGTSRAASTLLPLPA
jgi:asparagine synthase (glutamine-hydrolysing)